MCLILFAYKVHPDYKMIVAANRDEFYQRPTAPAHFWEESPEILAGRDLEKMGSWMGVTVDGRFAALTNYRDPAEVTEGKHSRGELIGNALKYEGSIYNFMKELSFTDDLYPGYNLLFGDKNELYYYSNIGKELKTLEPGIYGLSNHFLNTQWTKVKIGIGGLTEIIHGKQEDLSENLFTLLQHADPAPDELLPSTGVPFEWEKILSPLFIKSENYGTRSSTVLLVTQNEIEFIERVFSRENVSEQAFTINQ